MRRRIASKLSVALVAIIALGGLLMGFVITQNGTSLMMAASTPRLSQESKVVSIRLVDIFEALERDMEFLMRSPSVRRVISSNADSGAREQAQIQLQEVFAALLNNHPWYVQARLIGVADGGRELVRVNQADGRIQRVPDAELQRKGERPYFKEIMQHAPGSVYISAINLNREHGELSEPHLAVLRVGLPVVQPDGTPFGALVINVDARRVFDAARDVVSPGVTRMATTSLTRIRQKLSDSSWPGLIACRTIFRLQRNCCQRSPARVSGRCSHQAPGKPSWRT